MILTKRKLASTYLCKYIPINTHSLTELPCCLLTSKKERHTGLCCHSVGSYLIIYITVIYIIFQIIHSRINKHTTNSHFIWNTFPGSLHISQSYSRNLEDYPFYYTITGHHVPSKFTAVIYSTSSYLRETSPLYTLIQNVAKSSFLEKVEYDTFFGATAYNLPIARECTSLNHQTQKHLC